MADQPRLAVESIAGQRPYQEDSALAETLPDGRTLVAVADGMGGHAAGEVASRLALDTLVEAVGQRRGLAEAFRMANERVCEMAREPGKQGMGTTLVAILVDGSRYTVANVGDSRVYLVSADGIRRLTEDHSFVAEAMKRGQSEAEAMATPWKDALTRSIGTDEEVDADVTGPHELPSDAAFLICSDGLYKALDDEEIRSLFLKSSGAQGAAQSLVAAAFDAGSDDNISVAIAEYGEVPRDAAPTTMVLSYDPEQAAEAARAEAARSGEGAAYGRTDGRGTAPATAVEESTVAAGLPVAAVAAVVVVVGALLAILLFG
ncbi:MAG TPA: protein phosphatase 2C domain-containing protein [Longimicrobiales bacterium]|nr:protein phosphatase 2C domain-containing protein [Longimicrobiales bacterium]